VVDDYWNETVAGGRSVASLAQPGIGLGGICLRCRDRVVDRIICAL
jgi:hypothetical protein